MGATRLHEFFHSTPCSLLPRPDQILNVAVKLPKDHLVQTAYLPDKGRREVQRGAMTYPRSHRAKARA